MWHVRCHNVKVRLSIITDIKPDMTHLMAPFLDLRKKYLLEQWSIGYSEDLDYNT